MPKQLPKEQKTLDFEASLTTLDGLVNKLEAGELSLEESLSAFEDGINLTRQCQQHLSNAEQKVSMLVGNDDALQLAAFDSPESNWFLGRQRLMPSFNEFNQQYREHVNLALMARFNDGGQSEPRLLEAMKYSLLSGGKRVRPLLVYASALAVDPFTELSDSDACSV